MRLAPDNAIPRIEAFFAARAYAPHRHDTYAIGVTMTGVQTFDYRGATRHSLAGEVMVLYPDETHDGRAGADGGFRYRMLYLAPERLQAALGARPLPFLRGGVSRHPLLRTVVIDALRDLEAPLDALQRHDLVVGLGGALEAATGRRPERRPVLDMRALDRARRFLRANLHDGVCLRDLEAASGLDRFALSRQFRAAFGTSPYRYRTMRRLEAARDRIAAGRRLADVAAECGFADQSHMTRQFRRAFGLSPGRWAALLASSPKADAGIDT